MLEFLPKRGHYLIVLLFVCGVILIQNIKELALLPASVLLKPIV